MPRWLQIMLAFVLPTMVWPAMAQPTKDEIVRKRWVDCIGSSFSQQLYRIGDKNMAGENALNACKAERKEWIRVLTVEMGITPPELVTGAADSLEYDLKGALVRGAR
jgi:hypothetical protein